MSRPIDPQLAREAVHTIKFLAVDAVERANSGHPGLPMGAADVAFVLWSRFLRYDPTAPDWEDRDRFVLSAGHGSMLAYAILHLAGFDLPMSELQAFRQLGSKTPGHPEFGHTVGIEATTGPLGQGVGNGVGMALAAKMLAARFNAGDDFRPVTRRVYVLASDGDMMEGVSAEACALAGHLGLDNLVVLYDSNRITIEGSTDLAWSEDVGKRYEAYGWHVEHVDGHDHEAIAAAVDRALAQTGRPSLLVCETVIAKGAVEKEGSADAHGSPLGEEEVRRTKERADWPHEPFHVPDRVRDYFRERAAEGAALRTGWEARFAEWRSREPALAAAWDEVVEGRVPGDIVERLVAAAPAGPGATRQHGAKVLAKAAELVPALVGGSADLAPSTLTLLPETTSVRRGSFAGRNLHFGIREHAMGSVLNGIAYHGGFRPFGSTFLVFSDYMRPSIRIAALARLPVVYVFTHDSIHVGEDGPTHQPIEHAASLRLIPNLVVFRPADGAETALAWGKALERRDGPTAILLTRQKLPPLEGPGGLPVADASRGGWVVADAEAPEVVLAATGSEVHLALDARRELAAAGRRIRVVSVTSLELLLGQDRSFRESLFPKGVPVATIEAGRTDPWRVLAGTEGWTFGIDGFGTSAPGPVVAEHLGLTAGAVARAVLERLS
jgi:transketolase